MPVLSSYPFVIGDKPFSWAGFKAVADGGRHKVPWCIGARLSVACIYRPGPLFLGTGLASPQSHPPVPSALVDEVVRLAFDVY